MGRPVVQVGPGGALPASRRRRAPKAPGPGALGPLARALLALAEEVHAEDEEQSWLMTRKAG